MTLILYDVHGGHGVHGLHPRQLHAHLSASRKSPVHADKFAVPHEPLGLLHVTVLIHVVHGGYGEHGLHPKQLNAHLSASRTTSCAC
jgi:hypothetical protein